MSQVDICILGAGLAGLSTAFFLEEKSKKDYLILEKEKKVGGLCRREQINGFSFCYGGHLLHFKTKAIKKIVLKVCQNSLRQHQRKALIYLRGKYHPYPFQTHLFGQSPQIVAECLMEFAKVYFQKRKEESKNFYQWIINNFGQGIVKYFMLPYNRKLWTVSPHSLTTDWIDRFIPKPDIKQVFMGALSNQPQGKSYNATFWYPKTGTIEKLPQAFAKRLNQKTIQLNSKVIKINTQKKQIIIKQGDKKRVYFYNNLVSSLPLKKLIALIKHPPVKIKKLARRLKHNSVYCINLGLNHFNLPKAHWIYFPEKKYCFYRIILDNNFSSFISPPGQSVICTEVSYSQWKRINKRTITTKVINDLIRVGIIKNKKEVEVKKIMNIKYAYVIYDKNYKKAVANIHSWLLKNQVYSIGRYGKWEYSTMEEAIIQGKKIASKLLKK